MSGAEIERRRVVALQAAREAAALCAQAAAGPRVIRSKGHLDVVTETDAAAEQSIVARLRAAFPHDRIVGEEGTGGDDLSALAAPGFCWLLDPICGTDNFAYHLSALYCTNVALLLDGVVVLGVVVIGGRDEALWTVRGGGAWVDEAGGATRPLSVSSASGIVALDLGSGPSRGRPERPARLAAALIGRNRFAIRILSTSATLAQQATGALAGNVFEEAKPWDLAAGALLLTEAGAPVADLWGRPWTVQSTGLISGATRAIHDELVAAVALALHEVAEDRRPATE